MSATLTTMAVLAIATASGHPSSTNSRALMHPFPDTFKQVQVVNPTCPAPLNRCAPCEQTPALAQLPVSTMADKPHTNKTCNVRPLSKKKAQQKARRKKLIRKAALKAILEAPHQESPYQICNRAVNDCLERPGYFDSITGVFTTAVSNLGKSLASRLTISQRGRSSECQAVFEDCMHKELKK